MRKILLTFLLFCFSAFMFAQEKKVLGVYMNDGTSVCFYLSEQPLVTFIDDAVKIVSDTEEALIKRSLVDRFEFLAEMPTGIGQIEEDGAVCESFELDGNAIRVNGLVPGSKVQIYSVNGQLLMDTVATADGCATLQIGSLLQGIYLIDYNETTIKFIKR